MDLRVDVFYRDVNMIHGEEEEEEEEEVVLVLVVVLVATEGDAETCRALTYTQFTIY